MSQVAVIAFVISSYVMFAGASRLSGMYDTPFLILRHLIITLGIMALLILPQQNDDARLLAAAAIACAGLLMLGASLVAHRRHKRSEAVIEVAHAAMKERAYQEGYE